MRDRAKEGRRGEQTGVTGETDPRLRFAPRLPCSAKQSRLCYRHSAATQTTNSYCKRTADALRLWYLYASALLHESASMGDCCYDQGHMLSMLHTGVRKSSDLHHSPSTDWTCFGVSVTRDTDADSYMGQGRSAVRQRIRSLQTTIDRAEEMRSISLAPRVRPSQVYLGRAYHLGRRRPGQAGHLLTTESSIIDEPQ